MQIGGRKMKNKTAKERYNQYFITFRYGECPNGKFSFTEIHEKTKQRAWSLAIERYGNFAPYRVLTKRMFDKSEVKALGATLYEKIVPSSEKVDGFNKYIVEVVG